MPGAADGKQITLTQAACEQLAKPFQFVKISVLREYLDKEFRNGDFRCVVTEHATRSAGNIGYVKPILGCIFRSLKYNGILYTKKSV